MNSNSLTRAMVCSAALLVSACASVVSDNDSTTFIQTDPDKAKCELHGHNYRQTLETPNSILLPANAAPITVACTADGYKTATKKLDTKIDGWIFGNIILGGVVGAAIDLARGAGFKYPPQFFVYLQPEKFKTSADRDAWFDRRRKFINDEWDEVLKKVRNQCGTGTCEDEQRSVNAKRQEELDELEKQKETVVVEIPSA